MHVIIGILTALTGLVWALYSLHRAGFDVTSLDPTAWARRRKWRRLYGTKPIFTLEQPMEVAALLIIAVLKQEGEISREQKAAVIDIFQSTFHQTEAQARDVFASSVYLLKDELNLDQSVPGILAVSRDRFTTGQAESLLTLLEQVASLEGPVTDAQRRIIDAVRTELARPEAPTDHWS